MAQINKPDTYFNTKLYTGTSATHNITGVGFQPDFVWLKRRDNVGRHRLFDAVRGATKSVRSDATDAEITRADSLTSFDSDGFTLGSDSASGGINVNISGETMVGWNWLGANGTASNTDGSITSTVSANTTSGFSIVKWTGNATSGATVGHGLGSAPKVVITKRTDGGTNNWVVGHSAIGFTEVIYLNSTNAKATDSGSWNNTAPSSSVFTVGSNNESNGSGYEFISYCFAEKKGFSKFGSYTGNGSTDGTFVYTGFKPAFILVKSSSASVTGWNILDNKRDPENVMDTILQPNNSNADANDSNKYCDFLSNGFKWRAGGGETNGSGTTYIYMAFAENPLVGTNNIPATAR